MFKNLVFAKYKEKELQLDLLYTVYGLIVTYPLIFLAVFVYQLGGILATALIYSVSAFSIGAAPIFIGPISDKTGYRIRYAIISMLAGSILMLFSTFSQFLAIPIMIISSAILQIGQPLFISYETERSKRIGSSVGKIYVFINLGYLFGSLLFGYVISSIGFVLTTIIFSLTSAFLALFFLKVNEERIFVNNPYKLGIIDSILNSKPKSIIYSSLVFIPALFFSIVPAYYVFFLESSVFEWGVVNFISTLTGVIASKYVGNIADKFGIKNTLLIGSSYYPIYYLTLLLYPDPLIFAILYSLPFWLFIWIPLYSYSAQISEIYERATYVSNINFLIGIFRSLGGILGGLLVMFFDLNTFFIISIALSVLIPLAIKVYKA